MDDILKQVGAAAATTLVTGLLGRVFVNTQSDGKPSSTHVRSVWAVALLIGTGAFVALFLWSQRKGEATAENTSLPVLQGIVAKPNSVSKGDRVTVTVQLDRAAPLGGASVALTSSDPAILTVDGNAIVPEGAVMGTGYSQAVDVPSYLSPVQISASYNSQIRQTEVNVTRPKLDPSPVRPHPVARPVPSPISTSGPVSAPSISSSGSVSPTPRAAPLDPELVGRLEDAQGRLAAEKSHWEGVQRNMAPGTSLRPEIRSQLFAAESASQRCTNDRQASDANSLKSCVDVLNDHLTQLKIQH